MSTRRTITVTLTEAQMDALRGAVSLAGDEWAEMGNDETAQAGGYFGAQVRTLDRAWAKIAHAWHSKQRRT